MVLGRYAAEGASVGQWCHAHGGAQVLTQVVRDLDEAGIVIDDIGLRRPTLDDVFLSLTGHASEEDTDAETAAAKDGKAA